jgi:DNA-binding response OmpR family regulator
VIVLDLNLPKMDGFGVLAALGQCRELAAIPVFILSTSGHPNDKRKSAELGVRKYFEKPNNFDDYADIIREICSPILERAA